jgi:HprK-related kinase A
VSRATAAAPPPPATLGSTPTTRLATALRQAGLWLHLGAVTVRVQSDNPHLPAQLRSTYRHHPFQAEGDWADVHVAIRRGRGLRRWFRPQTEFVCDSRKPFQPFPGDHGLPLFEWGVNTRIGETANHLLLLHAAVLERDGRALVLPALPGSGKSTLAAALSLRGWRLLSDEFGALDPLSGHFQAVLKPTALKNQSIEVIRAFEPTAPLGPTFPKTRKGDVAHLAAGADAVARRHEPAAPGLVVLPRWVAGSPTRCEPMGAEATFRSLAFNAFNYRVLGATGFDAVVRLARLCPAWELSYSQLDEAIALLGDRWQALPPPDGGPTP